MLYKAAGAVTSRPRMLAGPDWSDPNIDPKKLQWCAPKSLAAEPSALPSARVGGVLRVAMIPEYAAAATLRIQRYSALLLPPTARSAYNPPYPPKPIRWLSSVKPWLGMVSVHLYGGDVINDKKIDTILADKRMVGRHARLRNPLCTPGVEEHTCCVLSATSPSLSPNLWTAAEGPLTLLAPPLPSPDPFPH